jgi:hypothetical protein
MIKTFRGLLQNDTSTRIRLGTNDGLTGYTIKKLELISENPGATPHNENVVKVFTTPHAVTNKINFDDPTLIAAAFYTQDASRIYNPSTTIIVDNVKFNQDLYITVLQVDETGLCNFYLELEQVKLDINEATVATLKDMRGRE